MDINLIVMLKVGFVNAEVNSLVYSNNKNYIYSIIMFLCTWSLVQTEICDWGRKDKKNEGVQVCVPAFPSYIGTDFNVLGQGFVGL